MHFENPYLIQKQHVKNIIFIKENECTRSKNPLVNYLRSRKTPKKPGADPEFLIPKNLKNPSKRKR